MSNTVVVSISSRIILCFSAETHVVHNRPSNALTLNRRNKGAAYAQIIERVVQASQIDFEEGGIERQTLNELRDVSTHTLLFQNLLFVLFLQ